MAPDAATRPEPSVLAERALTDSALTDSALADRALTHGSVARSGGPRGGPTPARKTGYGGRFPRRNEAEEKQKYWLGVLDQGLKVTGDAWKRYATSSGRDQAALEKAVADSLEAFVKAEGLAMAKQLPFAKVIMVSVDLSLAFAEGVGRGIEKVSAENAKRWDFGRLTQEMTPDDVRLVNSMRGYLAHNTSQLNRVLAEGLADVAEKATGMLLDKLGEIPGKVLGDVAQQVAGQLVKQNELLAIFREAVEEAGKSIPAGRAKVEKLAFQFVANAYLAQMQDKTLQKKLAALPAVANSDKPVDVALLGTIIKMLAENSYDTYRRHVAVDYVRDELRQMLIQTARGLALGLEKVELEDSGSSEIVVEKDRIALPTAWLAVVTGSPDLMAELNNRHWAREKELIDYCKRLRLSVEAKGRVYAREYARRSRAIDEVDRVDLYNGYQDRYVRDFRDAFGKGMAAVEAIVDELGPAARRSTLEYDVRMHVGRPEEPPVFTRWVD